MKVNTVLGPVDAKDLGIVLPHEHLLIDLTNQYAKSDDPEMQRIGSQKVGPGNYEILSKNPYLVKDNLLLGDSDVAVKELGYFKKAGGKTVVELTSIGIGRKPAQLKEISAKTGINIILGSSYYTQDTHPEDIKKLSVEKIAEQIVKDITAGIDGTGIKAGVIGEIGTSSPVHKNEKKVLQASALAHKKTKAPVQVHTYPWGETAFDILEILLEHVKPEKIVICHTDVPLDMKYIMDVLDEDVFIEFDNFGKEFPTSETEKGFAGGRFASDQERVKALFKLVDRGYEDQILISNDICLKQMLHTYGGRGYDHVLTNIVPMMLKEGISQYVIDKFLIHNPARWLS